MPTVGEFVLEMSHKLGYEGLLTDKILLYAVGVMELSRMQEVGRPSSEIETKLGELYDLIERIKLERRTIYRGYFVEDKVWVQ